MMDIKHQSDSISQLVYTEKFIYCLVQIKLVITVPIDNDLMKGYNGIDNLFYAK